MKEALVPSTRRAGVSLAAVTACVSGVAVFTNGYGVRRWSDPTAYTTAKNLVAAVILGVAFAAMSGDRPRGASFVPRDVSARAGMVVIAVIGGSVPFVLFFEGLARASSSDTAFIHKTLVLWVLLLAVPLLRERIGPLHVAAIALLLAGQALLGGGMPDLAVGSGEMMVLAATGLWAVETVVVKRLLVSVPPLTLGVARLAGGVVVLLAWLVVQGDLGAMTAAGASAWGWALLTGAFLATYVASWFAALARAQAVDVTAVLVVGALVTIALESGIKGVPTPDPAGILLLVTGGTLAIGTALLGDRAPRQARA